MPIQILLIAAIAAACIATWKRARERVIRVPEAIAWSIVWVAAAFVILKPETTSRLANMLGVGRGADLVLYASVVALFFLMFKIFMSLDAIEKHLTHFVRKDALRDIEKQKK